MTTREALHQMIDEMSEEEAKRLLEICESEFKYDELTEEEVERVLQGQAAIGRGDVVKGEDLERDLGL